MGGGGRSRERDASLSLLLPFPLSLFLSSPHFLRALSRFDSRRSFIGKEETTRSLCFPCWTSFAQCKGYGNDITYYGTRDRDRDRQTDRQTDRDREKGNFS